jgi:tetratricopeptide (TPR) repeat protein
LHDLSQSLLQSRDRQGAGDRRQGAGDRGRTLHDLSQSLLQSRDRQGAFCRAATVRERVTRPTPLRSLAVAARWSRPRPARSWADVFALGSILATILTGQPAFVDNHINRILIKTAKADLADVRQRLAACGADAELLAIAHRCLAANPEDRFADGREVAAAVAAYRATVVARLRQAETAAAEALVREAEQRKRRWLAVTLGGGIAAVLLIGLAVSLWQMHRAITAEGQAKANEQQALANAERAEANEQQALANAQLAQANEQQALANAEQERLAKLQAEAEKKKALAFRNQALDALRATTGSDVERLLGERKELTANERAYLEAIAQRWQTFARQEGTDDQSRAVAAEGHFRVAFLWAQLGRRDEAKRKYEQAIALWEKLVAEFPTVPDYRRDWVSELARSHNNLGALLRDTGKRDEAEEQYRSSLAIREKLVAEFPTVPDYRSDLASSHNNLRQPAWALFG